MLQLGRLRSEPDMEWVGFAPTYEEDFTAVAVIGSRIKRAPIRSSAVGGPDGQRRHLENCRGIFGVHKEGWGRAGALRVVDVAL